MFKFYPVYETSLKALTPVDMSRDQHLLSHLPAKWFDFHHSVVAHVSVVQKWNHWYGKSGKNIKDKKIHFYMHCCTHACIFGQFTCYKPCVELALIQSSYANSKCEDCDHGILCIMAVVWYEMPIGPYLPPPRLIQILTRIFCPNPHNPDKEKK